MGSGVVISEDGTVLCAAHVCGQPNKDVRVVFPNGKSARGKTLGTNHEMDAGLMKITEKGHWPHVEIGDLQQVHLGDWVLALGFPGATDLQRSLVVRLGRIISFGRGAIRTDCTLIGGDSGGPLFDMYGRLIGIHSRISDSIAENFHVPVGAYVDSWDRLAKGENWGDRRPPPQPYVGARGVDHPEGCQLERVEENSPAFKAGLKAGDIVLKVNGQEVTDRASFRECVARSKPGQEVQFEVKRGDQEMTVKVTVEARRRGGRFGR